MRRLCTERTVVQNKQPEPKIKAPPHTNITPNPSTNTTSTLYTCSLMQTHAHTHTELLVAEFQIYIDKNGLLFLLLEISFSVKGTAHECRLAS